MADDERAIRNLVATWMKASEAGDVSTVLNLMADDVLFTVPGREPFGKDTFRTASEAMKNVSLRGTSDIREIKILGDWAYIRNYIEITITPPGGDPVRREHALWWEVIGSLRWGVMCASMTASFRSADPSVERSVIAWVLCTCAGLICNYIEITITPPGGDPVRRKGYTLSILRKQTDGKWVLWRDANLVA